MSDSIEIPESERLQKVIAHMGIASRRHAELLIRQGLVKVNGITVTEQGLKVTSSDVIEVSGSTIKKNSVFTYILLNKPEGVITSASDPQQRKTVIDLIKSEIKQRVYPVGRLDYDTSGLLILTNDGELTYRLTHPSYGVDKTYRVWIEGNIPEEILHTLRNGVHLEDGITSPAKIRIVKKGNKGKDSTAVEITIHEGKNRQVKRMFEKVGYPVIGLQRIAFGTLHLDNLLKPGEFRHLLEGEVNDLKKEVGL